MNRLRLDSSADIAERRVLSALLALFMVDSTTTKSGRGRGQRVLLPVTVDGEGVCWVVALLYCIFLGVRAFQRCRGRWGLSISGGEAAETERTTESHRSIRVEETRPLAAHFPSHFNLLDYAIP